MSSVSSARLLQLALPLVQTHGFTRKALSLSVLALPAPHTHSEPLSETAVSALFGKGDEARRTLINAWLDDGIQKMREISDPSPTIKAVLRARLQRNEPVIQYLPEAFALLASPTSGFPPLDARPALKAAAKIADEACYITGDKSLHLSWYARRGSLAVIYSAAELHQLTSPTSAYAFLDSLLGTSAVLKKSIDEVELFSAYIAKSWAGIIRSTGVL